MKFFLFSLCYSSFILASVIIENMTIFHEDNSKKLKYPEMETMNIDNQEHVKLRFDLSEICSFDELQVKLELYPENDAMEEQSVNCYRGRCTTQINIKPKWKQINSKIETVLIVNGANCPSFKWKCIKLISNNHAQSALKGTSSSLDQLDQLVINGNDIIENDKIKEMIERKKMEKLIREQPMRERKKESERKKSTMKQTIFYPIIYLMTLITPWIFFWNLQRKFIKSDSMRIYGIHIVIACFVILCIARWLFLDIFGLLKMASVLFGALLLLAFKLE